MKGALALVLILSAVGASAEQPVADAVWETVHRLDRALVAKDAAALGEILTEDFVGAIPSGRQFSKNEYIEHHCRPGVGLTAIADGDRSAATVRVFGEVAVVNRRVHVRLRTPDGSEREIEVQRIEVCVKDDGGWRVASGQGTEVNLALRP